MSLFNRARAQAGSTRYLQGTERGFAATTREWGTFNILPLHVAAGHGGGAHGGSYGGAHGGGGAATIVYHADVVIRGRGQRASLLLPPPRPSPAWWGFSRRGPNRDT